MGANVTTDIHAAQPMSSALARIQAALAPSTDADRISPFDVMMSQRMILLGICAIIDRMSQTGTELLRRLGPALAAYLRHDFPQISIEEEEGLLPLLRQRMLLGDDLDQAIQQSLEEHRRDVHTARSLAQDCDALGEGMEAEEIPAVLAALRAFAEQQRRHLAWEEAIILPLARTRLSERDLTVWARAIRARKRLLS